MKSYIIKKTELEKLQKELDEKEKAQIGYARFVEGPLQQRMKPRPIIQEGEKERFEGSVQLKRQGRSEKVQKELIEVKEEREGELERGRFVVYYILNGLIILPYIYHLSI